MTAWLIKYRAPKGVAHMTVMADTLEEAEREFHNEMLVQDQFGVIVKTTPNDPLAHL